MTCQEFKLQISQPPLVGPHSDPIEPARRSTRLMRLIQGIIAQIYAIHPRDLLSPNRGLTQVAHARQIAMYLAHVICGIDLSEIGRAYGRDRTTVRYACGAVEDRRDDPDFDLTIELVVGIFRHLRDATYPDALEPQT
ncbi:MAG: helix-turn-helix domain-containing protein [Hyphomicrobiaceae bacterium]